MIRDGALEEIDSWEEDMMAITLEKFSGIAQRSSLVVAFGNQREITDDEMVMSRSLTDDGGEMVYTPLSVSTQAVAGTNYRFYCRFEDLSDGVKRKDRDESDKYGYCWITVFKPLPGRGRRPSVPSSVCKKNFI